jgi:hypothetical protein
MDIQAEIDLKDLTTVVNFYRLLLKQADSPAVDVVENYVASLLDRLVINASPPNAQHREIIAYRKRLMDFIKS